MDYKLDNEESVMLKKPSKKYSSSLEIIEEKSSYEEIYRNTNSIYKRIDDASKYQLIITKSDSKYNKVYYGICEEEDVKRFINKDNKCCNVL
jgi:hypothetical protein